MTCAWSKTSAVENKIVLNQNPSDYARVVKDFDCTRQLSGELHKPIIKKIKKRKVHSSFKDNIWGGDLADMQLTSKFNKGFRFLLCVLDIHSKYAWVVLKQVLQLLILFNKY